MKTKKMETKGLEVFVHPKQGKKRGRPAGSKNKPKPVILQEANWSFMFTPNTDNGKPTLQVDVKYLGEGATKKD